MKDYREIRPDFTVDRYTDGQAPTANINSFQRLVNFIPKCGRVATRFGIQELVHTPEATATVWTPEVETDSAEITVPGDALDFAVIQAILPFNNTASIGVNLLNNKVIYTAMYDISSSAKCTVYNALKVEGAGSIIMTNDTALNTSGQGGIYGMRGIGNPWGTFFPGHSVGQTNKFMITYWVYPFKDDGSAMWHFTFGNSGDPSKLAFGIRQFNQNLQSYWQNQSGNTISTDEISNVVYANEWNFIAAWCDTITNFQGLYIKNDTLGEVYTANENPISATNFYTHSAGYSLNGKYIWTGDGWRCDNSDAYHGLMDYVTMWSRPMHLNNSSNITLCRLLQGLAWTT